MYVYIPLVGNPTVVTGAQNRMLRVGWQERNSRPRLVAFVSGRPYPTASDITWLFNNGSLPSSVVAMKNVLFLPSFVTSAIEGVYTCHVTTSAGTASDDIHVTLTCEYIVM